MLRHVHPYFAAGVGRVLRILLMTRNVVVEVQKSRVEAFFFVLAAVPLGTGSSTSWSSRKSRLRLEVVLANELVLCHDGVHQQDQLVAGTRYAPTSPSNDMEGIRWELRNPQGINRKLIDQPTTARDLTLEAARDAGPRKNTKALPAAQIKKLLDSKHEREVLDGLRRVVAVCLDHMYILIAGMKLIQGVDAICQSSPADSHFLSQCAEDALEYVSFYEASGVQLSHISC